MLFALMVFLPAVSYAGWGTPQTLDSSGYVGTDSSIAVDSSGNVHISYRDTTNQDLKYIMKTAEGWGTPQTLDSSGNVGVGTSIAVDSVGDVHITYFDNANHNLKYIKRTSGVWGTPQTLDSSGLLGWNTSIGVDSIGNVHISYYDYINRHLMYIKQTSGVWGTPQTIETGNKGSYNSIAVDSWDNVHISYYDDTNNDLKYIKQTSGVWGTPKKLDNAGDMGRYNSIAIDLSGIVHISYYDYSGYDLKYVKMQTSGAWSWQTLHSTGYVGSHNSIAVDSSGNVHISYYDTGNSDLKYIKQTSGVWGTSQTLDSSGSVGSYTSIAVDAIGNVHISYFDSTNSDLKYIEYINDTIQGMLLTVTKSGTGSGIVTSTPSGINCGADCIEGYNDGTVVTLTASANAGSIFTGWSGDADCADGVVTMSAHRTCIASFAIQTRTLNVTQAGTGSGTISSSPAGINCGADCAEDYNYGTVVTLTANPDAGSAFTGWSGDSDCVDGTVTMNAAKTCTATFALTYRLTINKTGSGTGTVTSSPSGINCGADCIEDYNTGTVVTLTASPNTGSIFSGWSGDADCSDGTVTMNMVKNCTATFDPIYVLNINKIGNGAGAVTSIPAGINCGADCTEDYENGTVVTLTATPDAGFTFSGWGGHPDCSDGSVTVNTEKTCTATFTDWTLETLDTSIGLYSISSRIALDNYGLPHIAYGYNGTIFHAYYDGSIWHYETVTSGRYPSIAVDQSGDVHVSYAADYVNGLNYIKKTGGVWGTLQTLDTSGYMGASSIAVDQAGDVHISYYGGLNWWSSCSIADVRYIKQTAGVWGAPEVVDGVCINQESISIAVGSAGQVYISYTTIEIPYYYDYIYIAIKTTSSWGISGLYNFGIDNSIAVGPSGDLHLTYYDYLNGDLEYIKNPTSYLNPIQVLDSSGDVGASNSIAVDPSGNAHVSYYDGTNGDLKYIKQTAGIWEAPQTVDSSGDVGQYTSIAVGSIGDVHISYLDSTNGDLKHAERPQKTLTVIKTGTGSGIVTSSPAGISCGADCSEDYDKGTVVTLTAAPDTGSIFTGWSGDADCSDGTVTMNADRTCTATFDYDSGYLLLNINKSGSGAGTVTSSPAGIDCGADCSGDYDKGTVVTLTAAPDTGSIFTGWSGDTDCVDGTVTMDAGKNCIAGFDLNQPQLTTLVSPSGNGSVSPDCSGGCVYVQGTQVVLTANEDSGYPFSSWTGCDTPAGKTCTMTVDADKSVTAVYDSCMYPARGAGAGTDYYYTIQDAYDEAGSGETVQVRYTSFSGDLSIDINKSVTIKGGYNCDYTGVAGRTTINGDVAVTDGTVTIEDIEVH